MVLGNLYPAPPKSGDSEDRTVIGMKTAGTIRAHKTLTPRHIAFWCTVALTIAAAALRMCAFFTGYDAAIGYFDSTAVTTIYRILCGLVVLTTGICAFMTPADQMPHPPVGQSRELAAALPLAARILLTIYLFVTAYDNARAGAAGSNSPVLYITLCLTLLSAVYFLLLLTGRGSRHARGLLGLAALLPSVGIIALTYSDGYVTMNSPVKLAVQFAAVGIMLALTAELRFLLDKPAPRLALVLWSVATFLCLGGALPCLVAQLAGIVPSTRPEGMGLYQGYLMLACLEGIYLLFRLYTLTRHPVADPDRTPAEEVAEAEAIEPAEPNGDAL